MSELTFATFAKIVLVVRVLIAAKGATRLFTASVLAFRLLIDPVTEVMELVMRLLKLANGATRLFTAIVLTFRLLTDPVTVVIELVVSVLKVAKGPVIPLIVSVLALKVLTDPSLVTTLSETKDEMSALLMRPAVKLILDACKELISRVLNEM